MEQAPLEHDIRQGEACLLSLRIPPHSYLNISYTEYTSTLNGHHPLKLARRPACRSK